jgi:hypothetical protein
VHAPAHNPEAIYQTRRITLAIPLCLPVQKSGHGVTGKNKPYQARRIFFLNGNFSIGTACQ